MNKKHLIFIGYLFLILGCNNSGDGRESFGDKTEWSILQVIESQNRDQTYQQIEIVEKKGYYIAIIPEKDGLGVIAILLNPGSAPFYKQMPNKQFNISKDQYNKIISSDKVISTVAEALESHVSY